MVRWQGGKDGRVVRWQDDRFSALFKGGERRVRPRYLPNVYQDVFKIF